MIAQILLQSALSLFLSLLSENVVTLDYSLVIPGSPDVAKGVIALSDKAFRIQDDRQEIWCTASERWIVDRTEKEACVETVEGLDASGVMSLFTIASESPDGRFELRPAGEAAYAVHSLVLVFDGSRLKKAEVTLEAGAKPVLVEFSSQQIKDPESESFIFEADSLPEGYVVTDLR